jgi:hypothetical protein
LKTTFRVLSENILKCLNAGMIGFVFDGGNNSIFERSRSKSLSTIDTNPNHRALIFAQTVKQMASSPEFVGELRFRKFAELVI